MKKSFTTALSDILADKTLLASLVSLLVVALVYILYFALSVQPNDLQVSSHYTAYGQEHFYRDPWTYLLSFAGFGVLVALLHPVIVMKLYKERGRGIAVLFCWVSIGLLLVAARLLYEIIKISALSYA
jgi:hypothetical protein